MIGGEGKEDILGGNMSGGLINRVVSQGGSYGMSKASVSLICLESALALAFSPQAVTRIEPEGLYNDLSSITGIHTGCRK